MRRFLALFRKEFLQILRDKASLRLLFVVPILQSIVLGYAMTREVRDVPVAFVDLDRSVASLSLVRRIAANERFLDQGPLPDVPSAQEALREGRVLLALVVPRGFGSDLQRGLRDGEPPEEPVRIQLLLDGVDPSTAGTAASYLAAIVAQWSTETLASDFAAQGIEVVNLQPLDARDRILFNPDLEFSWSMVPGMVILLVTMVGALLTSFSLVREREAGTLEQLLVTPVRPIHILLGKALPYWILSQVVFWIAFFASGLWFGIPIGQANLAGLAVGLALYALTSVGLGILVSTVVGSQQQALFLIWFCLIFFVLTSGLLLPFESMPPWMQTLTEGNAVRHFLYLVRALVLRGASPSALWPEYLKLALIGIVLFGAGMAAFRRTST